MGWEIFWGLKFSLTLRLCITFFVGKNLKTFFNIENRTSTLESTCLIYFSVAPLGVLVLYSFCCAGIFYIINSVPPPPPTPPTSPKKTMVSLLARR